MLFRYATQLSVPDTSRSMQAGIRLVVALPAEAKPINHQLGLVRDNRTDAFPLYRNNNIALVLCSPGKLAAAEATRWLAGYLPSAENTLWLNIGIAGHPTRELGEALLAGSVSDGYQGATLQTVPPGGFHCPTAPLVTLSEPGFDYSRACLLDMEGFGFFSTAVDFAPPERVQCLKIVSDNRKNSATQISAKMVRDLMQQNLDTVQQLIEALGGRA